MADPKDRATRLRLKYRSEPSEFGLDLYAAWWDKEVVYKTQDGFRYLELQDLGVPLERLGFDREPWLLVRPEYDAAYDYLVSLSGDDPVEYPNVVLTGHPGIGKTLFAMLALRWRMAEKKPTAIQLEGDAFHLFDADGAWKVATHRETALVLPRGAWVFSDSAGLDYTPAEAFLMSDFLCIQITPPAAHRWKQWTKQRGALFYIIELWSNDEIRALCRIENLNEDLALTIARDFGPTIRNILSIVKLVDEAAQKQAIERYREQVRAYICDLPDTLPASIANLHVLEFSSGSGPSTVFHLKPDPHDRASGHLYIPSTFLMHEVVLKLAQLDADRQVRWFTVMKSHASTRPTACAIYESFVHPRLLVNQPQTGKPRAHEVLPDEDQAKDDDGEPHVRKRRRSGV